MLTKEIYKTAVRKWGKKLQYLCLIEEMSELTKEIIKHMRGKNDLEKIAEEVADVEVMLGQIKDIFNIEESVLAFKKKKLKRVERMLNEED